MEVNLLFPVQIVADCGVSHIFFVDYATQRVLDMNGSEVSSKLKEAILNDLWQQRQLSAVESPAESVKEAINIQKEISLRGDREHGSI